MGIGGSMGRWHPHIPTILASRAGPPMTRLASKQRRLSLHHLTAMDVSATDLVRLAAAVNCEHVCLFTYLPDDVAKHYPLVQAGDVSGLSRAMTDAGVTLHNIEVFPIAADTDFAAMETGLGLGARLGARHATAHVHEQDRGTARQKLQHLCDIAARHRIHVGIEYNPFSTIKTPADAASLVRACGRDNLGIIADFLHTMRSGAGPQALESISPMISGAQICDGPRDAPEQGAWREALSERLLPGDGTFPLSALLSALPHNMVIDVEVPRRTAMLAGLSAAQRVTEAVDAARSFVNADHVFDSQSADGGNNE